MRFRATVKQTLETKSGEIDRRQAGRWCSWRLTRRNPLSVIIISGTLSIERGSSRVRSIRLHLSKWEIMMGLAYMHHVKGSRENSIGKYSATYNTRVIWREGDMSNSVICGGNKRKPAKRQKINGKRKKLKKTSRWMSNLDWYSIILYLITCIIEVLSRKLLNQSVYYVHLSYSYCLRENRTRSVFYQSIPQTSLLRHIKLYI